MNCFVYCWKDTLTNKRYIGSHKGTPEDGYICSSKTMIEQYNYRSAFFVRQILAVFDDYDEAYTWETALLKKIDAANNPKYYNLHNNNGKFYCNKEIGKLISKAKLGKSIKKSGPRPHVNQTGENNNAFRGYYHTPWGKYASYQSAADACPYGKVGWDTIRIYIVNPNKVIQGSPRNKIVQPEWIGKTNKEIGFYFEPKVGV